MRDVQPCLISRSEVIVCWRALAIIGADTGSSRRMTAHHSFIVCSSQPFRTTGTILGLSRPDQSTCHIHHRPSSSRSAFSYHELDFGSGSDVTVRLWVWRFLLLLVLTVIILIQFWGMKVSFFLPLCFEVASCYILDREVLSRVLQLQPTACGKHCFPSLIGFC